MLQSFICSLFEIPFFDGTIFLDFWFFLSKIILLSLSFYEKKREKIWIW